MSDRYVIKGRRENRGKYLCYARMAGLPPGSGYVWLSEQRKAMRCGDPRYGDEKYTILKAREYNGYFVKLVCSKSIDVDDLRAFIAAHAAGASERLNCYWFGADFHDPGENFCRGCAEKLVGEKFASDPEKFARLYGECEDAEERYREAIDGGWRTEHDSPPSCATCGAPLDGSLTDYGVDEELSALTGECAPGFRDAEGWEYFDNALIDVSDDDPRWRKIARVVEAARKEESEAMPDVRATFLGVLSARATHEEVASERARDEKAAGHDR